MKIVILGTGYVGLVSGACFAEFGHHVVCIDKDQDKINALESGSIPIYEPGLKEIVQRGVSERRLFFETGQEKEIGTADAVFIAVGTPTSRRGDGYADLTYVYQAARDLAPFLNDYTVVVDKSTVPVGTARQVKRVIKETNPDADFDVASNPEFLREGSAVGDFMRPDRVVLGVENDRSKEILKRIYEPLYLIETPMVITDLETAELIKYATNAFLATKISFINEMSNLCEAVGGDISDLARGIGLDGRIGRKFLHPGPGYGGSCFPKDTLALVRVAQEHGAPSRIVETVIEVNAAQKAKMVQKIRKAFGGTESGKTITVLGLTFKPETDDMRESPSLTVLPALVEKGAIVRAHDPQGRSAAMELMPEMEYFEDPYAACENADGVVLMTEWNQYRALDLRRIKAVLKNPIFVDLRNVYDPKLMSELGFFYTCLGRECK
ncbi:MAG: UDP-glucose/GDP-mannose dehydrogenase family protein [Thermodesulfobacteriota bacterium]|nr:UDP-glucose/GDP-mannose dehydrogenase family protein [Thermodesulfobacteriota bacterium]